MNKSIWITVAIGALAVAVHDIVLVLDGELGTTLSAQTLEFSANQQGIPFAVGALVGHLFSRTPPDKGLKGWWGLATILGATGAAFGVGALLPDDLHFTANFISLALGGVAGGFLWPNRGNKGE